jgi:glucokinase
MVLTVTVGTGIGAGLVIDGLIERGRGFLGEVGHLRLDPRGPECGCGQSGCWEAVASGKALDRAARRLAADDPGGGVAAIAGSEEATGTHLTAAATAGDAAAVAALEEVASRFGAGLAGLVAVLDPDVIVVGGGVGVIGDLFLEPARRAAMSALSSGHVRRPTPIVAAHFGPDAGLVGAGLLTGS